MIIGVDLGGMSAKAACFSEGKLYGKSNVETCAENTPEETVLSLVKLCMTAAEKANKNFDDVQAIGIGSPGVVDSNSGTVVSWTNFHWLNIPLAELMEKRTGKKVFVLNDANAAAYGEAKFGAGAKYNDSVLITLGTGVGGGVILGGNLFEGYRSAGTEIGHMVIRQNGELCTCGRRGCLERYASARALVARTKEEMVAHPDSIMWKYAATLDSVDGRTVFLSLKDGDEAASNVFHEYIAALGEGIVNIANLLRPQAVIIGGGISAEGETLLVPLRNYVYPRLYVSDTYASFDIIKATLGNDAGLYGAAKFAFDRL